MQRYRRVWVVYRKELIDTLRDRRTLIAMILVPILLYPALMLILMQALRSEKGRREAERYVIAVPDEAHRAWLESVLRREASERELQLRERSARTTMPAPGEPETGDAPASDLHAELQPEQVEIRVAGAGASLWDLVDHRDVHLGIIVSPSPSESSGEAEDRGPGEAAPPNRWVQMIYRDTEPLSEFVRYQLERILEHESARIVDARIERLEGGRGLLTPLVLRVLSTAGREQQFAKILSMMVPFLLVIMTVTGAMYPAIDLTAGERERGTLETLAVSPVPTGQIVAGKFGVVVTIALLSTALNLASMTAMVWVTKLDRIVAGLSDRDDTGAAVYDASANANSAAARLQQENEARRRALEAQSARQPGFLVASAPIVMFAMLPFAVLFSGIMLATCSCARTFKEAQNYMMPVMMAALVPAMVVSYMPSVRLEGVLAVVPVANIVVLIRELFLGTWAAGPMALALGSTAFYAVAAVAIAARLYGNEAVLFSDVGSYRTLLSRRFMRPRLAPTPAAALLLLAIIFPVNFYWQSAMLDGEASAERALLVVAAAQALIIAGPALGLAWYLKLNWRHTFSLRAPSAAGWVCALMMAVSAAPVTSWLIGVQFRFWPPSGETMGFFGQLQSLFEGVPLAARIAVLAVVPGICEELLFRGPLLSGLRSRTSDFRAAVYIGLLFGLFHVFVEKIPVVAFMGGVLAWVCLRTGSILPAMLVHICHNGLPVLLNGVAALPEWARRALEGMYGAAAPAGDAIPAAAPDARTCIFIAVFALGLGLVTKRGRADLPGDRGSAPGMA